jgi:hypothetical protein
MVRMRQPLAARAVTGADQDECRPVRSLRSGGKVRQKWHAQDGNLTTILFREMKKKLGETERR